MVSSKGDRLEDRRLLIGEGRFVSDRIPQGALFAGFVRADIASGYLATVEVQAALELEGVVAVFTADDLRGDGVPELGHAELPRDDGVAPGLFPQPILCADRIRHIGEPIALVIARNREVLADAIEAVVCEIDEAEPVSGIAFCKRMGDGDAVAASAADAAYTVTVDLDVPRVTAMALEARGVVASGQGNRLHMISSTQNPFALRSQIAEHFGWDKASIHVEAQDVGGSFGLKGYMTREDAALAWAARRMGETLAWISTRSEAILSDAQGRGLTGRITLSLGEDRKIRALEASFEIDAGAYPDRRAFGIMNNANGLTGMYDIPNVSAQIMGKLSARAPLAPFRGNGRPEAAYAIERALDHAARKIGSDPIELRRRNLLQPEDFPVTTVLGATMDCGDFPAVMDAAEALAVGTAARRAAAEARGMLYGVGLANCVESAGGPMRNPRPDHARLTVGTDGAVTVAPGVMSVGQGHETVLSALVAEALQIAPNRIAYRNGDTSALTDGRGSGGSSGLTVAGSAVRVALDALLDQGRDLAAKRLGCPEGEIAYRDGAFHREDSNENVTLEGLAAEAGGVWMIEQSFTPAAATFPNGTHICEVEIDPETGAVTVSRYCAAEDVGRVINPVMVQGQLHGGIAQGLSAGLGERIVHDDSGQILTGSLMDYQVVRARDLPMFHLTTVEVPTALNPLGVKGVGEAGTVGSTAAFGLAVSDALARAGVASFELPATPGRVWQALHDAGVIGAA